MLKKKIFPFLLIIAFSLTFFVYYFIPFSWDLTSDKRFTLHPRTAHVLSELQQPLSFKIYLEGQLPPAYSKLRSHLFFLLNELQQQSGGKIHFSFEDPYALTDEKKREKLFNSLEKSGLLGHWQEFDQRDGMTKKIIFPGALLQYEGKKYALNFVRGSALMDLDAALNGLEYALIQKIVHIIQPQQQKIGFLQGHGELEKGRVLDAFQQLSEDYSVDFLTLKTDESFFASLLDYSLLIVNHPTLSFSEEEKFVLDQYLMHGRKMLFFMSNTQFSADTLRTGEMTYFAPLSVNLEDFFFRYGVKFNYNLVADAFCAQLQIPTGNYQGRTLYKSANWYFQPIVSSLNNHAINRNIPSVLLKYTSSIDVVREDVQQIVPLLQSSAYSTKVKIPATIGYEMALYPLNSMAKTYFPKSLLGVLLRADLQSLYKNRPLPLRWSRAFVEQVQAQELLVVSDGDFIANPYNSATGEYVPLGFDFEKNQVVYGNMDFLLNAVEHLISPYALSELRNRKINLYIFDQEKIREQAFFWKMFNIGILLVFLVLLGLFFWWYKRSIRAKIQ